MVRRQGRGVVLGAAAEVRNRRRLALLHLRAAEVGGGRRVPVRRFLGRSRISFIPLRRFNGRRVCRIVDGGCGRPAGNGLLLR